MVCELEIMYQDEVQAKEVDAIELDWFEVLLASHDIHQSQKVNAGDRMLHFLPGTADQFESS